MWLCEFLEVACFSLILPIFYIRSNWSIISIFVRCIDFVHFDYFVYFILFVNFVYFVDFVDLVQSIRVLINQSGVVWESDDNLSVYGRSAWKEFSWGSKRIAPREKRDLLEWDLSQFSNISNGTGNLYTLTHLANALFCTLELWRRWCFFW